jgi:hypothetical protein
MLLDAHDNHSEGGPDQARIVGLAPAAVSTVPYRYRWRDLADTVAYQNVSHDTPSCAMLITGDVSLDPRSARVCS